MALKIQFGEKSLPLNVRNHITENMPDLPRAFIIGLKAISDDAFINDPEDNIVRLNDAEQLYRLAQEYAPDYYAHTNAVIPDHVLTVLAGETELEHSEDLDAVLPENAAALLAEVRNIRTNKDLLVEPETSVDAIFVTLVKYSDEIRTHRRSLLSGDSGFDEECYETFFQAIYDYLRDYLLDAENTALEMMILQNIQAINFLRHNENTPHFWYLPVLRAPDFRTLDDDELIKRCGLPPHSTFESAFMLARNKFYYESGFHLESTFAQMADDALTPLRRYLEMSDCNDVVMASYLLLEHDLYDSAFMGAVLNGMGEEEGERIAHLHAARDDKKMWGSLPALDQHAIMDFMALKKSLQLEYECQYRNMLDADSEEYSDLSDSIAQSVEQLRATVPLDSIRSEKIKTFFLQQLERASPPEAPIPERIISGSWFPEPGAPANSNEPLIL